MFPQSQIVHAHTTSSSAVAKRRRDASCLSVQLARTYLQRSFLLLVIAASDLLVHKFLPNCFAVSYCLRRCSTKIIIIITPQPDKHHQVITPLFAAVRGSVGVRTPPRWSDRVRSRPTRQCQQGLFNRNIRRVLSYDVLRQQKTGVMTKGLTSFRLRRITSNPSQTLRRPLVRTTD